MNDCYPFAALVGQEQMRLALLLNAVHPRIGGVLIRGEKGTGKSTAARSLSPLLTPPRTPDLELHLETPQGRETTRLPRSSQSAPFVELPLGAGEERLVGSLDLEAALTSGRRRFEPGLLAQAHEGLLYVDEVNLLPDHLVDLLLDSAASGVNSVEREGLSIRHPARFMLVGTMNPEEGELRPQLLDRFGLAVQVKAPVDPEVRCQVIRRRMRYESDPSTFCEDYRESGQELRRSIREAAQRLPGVRFEEPILQLIARTCAAAEVEGLRADIVLCKAASAFCAWEGRTCVQAEDVRRCAPLVLLHRRKRNPFEDRSMDEAQLDDLVRQAWEESRLESPREGPSKSRPRESARLGDDSAEDD